MTLKCSVRETEPSHLQSSEVLSRQEAVAVALGVPGAPCKLQDSETKLPQSKRFGSPWKFHSPTPTVLVFLTPKFHLQGKSSAYRRENLFLKALIVLAIMGAISVEREIRPLFRMWQLRPSPPVVYNQSRSPALLGSAPPER